MMLDGVRVIELGANLAGPVAGEILAHMGADVIKVERPEGDDARGWGPPFWKGVLGPDDAEGRWPYPYEHHPTGRIT
jgi:crotonobetainyl-CoA:carnitine CoA-transferase CaiB-like acyl-CoA transferase